jgi:hypothetical protein
MAQYGIDSRDEAIALAMEYNSRKKAQRCTAALASLDDDAMRFGACTRVKRQDAKPSEAAAEAMK